MTKCECCDGGCKEKAEYECECCGMKYCRICAENSNFECDDCDQPPEIIPIKKPAKKGGE
jgi:hypothetical protein